MMRVEPTAPLWVAARALIAERKCDLEQRWNRAERTFDAEDIHDLRVSSRRLREALVFFSPCFPAKSLDRTSSRTKHLTRMLGTMRNTDEALIFFRSCAASGRAAGDVDGLLSQLEQERKQELKLLKAGLQSHPLAPLREQLDALLLEPDLFANERVDPFTQIAAFAREMIDERMKGVAELLPLATDEKQVEAQHRLRIAIKRLRYRYELLAPLAGSGHAELLATLKAYQDLLGTMHDLDLFAEMVAKRLPETSDRTRLLAEIAGQRHALFAAFSAMLRRSPLPDTGEQMRRSL
ncbi:MAG: CHAD domain-containing protein [Geobacter sp.]|nr:CHAD domain-containing protein [Geobacter sp.]